MPYISRRRSSQATVAMVEASKTSVELLAANDRRIGGMLYNDSNANLLIRFGTGDATSNLFTARLSKNGGYFEIPYSYTGEIQGIWELSNPSGAAMVTEIA